MKQKDHIYFKIRWPLVIWILGSLALWGPFCGPNGVLEGSSFLETWKKRGHMDIENCGNFWIVEDRLLLFWNCENFFLNIKTFGIFVANESINLDTCEKL